MEQRVCRAVTEVLELQDISPQEFDAMCVGAQVLEQDARGLKVLKLATGDILKLFRVKRLWSSARLVPYSKRFCRNATRLACLGVPTVSVRACFRLALPGDTAVLYQPLPGRTFRQIGCAEGLNSHLLAQLGTFVASLHQRGVYFRSLHLGNIVQMPNGELGLIDIADLSISRWPLFQSQRIRNFRHMCRLEGDRIQMGSDGWEALVNAYIHAAGLTSTRQQVIARAAEQIFGEG